MTLEKALKGSIVGTKIYVDNASQPFIVVARNNNFLIAVKRGMQTKHLAFDLNKNECGYFIRRTILADLSNQKELDVFLNKLTMKEMSIVEERKKVISDSVRRVKLGVNILWQKEQCFPIK